MFKTFLLIALNFGTVYASTREDAERILSKFANEEGLQTRLDQISKSFLGLPYGKGGPLGEGSIGRYDQDPLYRFDVFDCTTYVETVMALAYSRGVDEFETHQDKIRYKDGDVDYLKRNHFTDLQWIPENVQNGYMDEINTEIVSLRELKIAEAVINFPAWIRSHKIEQIVIPGASIELKQDRLEELKVLSTNYKSEDATLSYIPIVDLIIRPWTLDKIPSGTVVNFVRPNWDLTEAAGTHQNISHQGFLFKVGNVLYLRHASTSGKVEQLPFIDYLKKFETHPTLKGIHLMRVNAL
jgi:hypothetical protein